MKAVSRNHDESGMALLTVLLVMVLVSGLAVGMFAAVTMEQRSHAIDRDQTQVYAAAHAGLEKLTADLGALFLRDFSPDKNQLNALTGSTRLPVIPGFEYTAPGGSAGSGYAISWTGSPTADPVPLADTMITAGPYSGFKGLLTRYDITITARSQGGSEVRLRRGLQTVAVPVFQFGVFSDSDLTFFGGDNFDFGGRVHTNGNLWLSEAAGSTLLFTDKITAYGDVNRRYLSNGLEAATNGMSGNVQILTAIGNTSSARTLAYNSPNESSVTNNRGGFWTGETSADQTFCAPKAAPCWNANSATTNTGTPSWTTVSQTSYAGNLTNRHTGATVLRLPLVSQGATPIDLIRRPPSTEAAAGVVFGQRYFSMASLRILLSDRASDITSMATVTSSAPVLLDGDWRATPPTGYTVDATHPPIARSMGPAAGATTLASGNTVSSGLVTTLSLSTAIDPIFLAPGTSGAPAGTSMWITSTLPTVSITNCTARTATTFTGCTVGGTLGAAVNGTLSATLPSGVTVSAPLTNVVIPSGSNRTLTLASSGNMTTANTATPTPNPTPTARFVPTLMWVVPSTAGTQGKAISCEGYNLVPATKTFTNCRGVTTNAEIGSGFTISSQATSALNKGLIGGYIKIEKQTTAGVWSDVTMEILNLGIGDTNQEGYGCGDPTPNAVLRIQRLRDNGNRYWYRQQHRRRVPLRKQSECARLVAAGALRHSGGHVSSGQRVCDHRHNGRRHDGLYRARREQPEALAGRQHRQHGQPGRQRQRLHRLLL